MADFATVSLPSVSEVEKSCESFDEDAYNRVREDGLRKLRDAFPVNTDPSEVLLKVVTLDNYYSTRILNIHLEPLARHIASLPGLDEQMKAGDNNAVEKIWKCVGTRHYYSFATKYCSWHNPLAYPLFDTRVREYLCWLRNTGHLPSFRTDDLWDYSEFVKIVSSVRDSFGLQDLSFRAFDKFLWTQGDVLMRAKEGDKAPASAAIAPSG